MTHNIGTEATGQQLHLTRSVESNYMVDPSLPLGIAQHICVGENGGFIPENLVRKIQHTILSYADEYSLIEEEHPKLFDITKPNRDGFRWSVEGSVETKIILDTSGKFGPLRFVELKVDPIDDFVFDIHINRVYFLKKSEDGCLTPFKRDILAEGQTIRLFSGQFFSNCQLETMAILLESEYSWEELTELKLIPLIQYWAFHHHEAVNWLHQEEMYDA
jgi:hypothetical protein